MIRQPSCRQSINLLVNPGSLWSLPLNNVVLLFFSQSHSGISYIVALIIKLKHFYYHSGILYIVALIIKLKHFYYHIVLCDQVFDLCEFWIVKI